MKVVCINNGNAEYLTIGKIYWTNEEDNIISKTHYLIKDDNDTGWYGKRLFKTMDEVRNEKLDQIL